MPSVASVSTWPNSGVRSGPTTIASGLSSPATRIAKGARSPPPHAATSAAQLDDLDLGGERADLGRVDPAGMQVGELVGGGGDPERRGGGELGAGGEAAEQPAEQRVAAADRVDGRRRFRRAQPHRPLRGARGCRRRRARARPPRRPARATGHRAPTGPRRWAETEALLEFRPRGGRPRRGSGRPGRARRRGRPRRRGRSSSRGSCGRPRPWRRRRAARGGPRGAGRQAAADRDGVEAGRQPGQFGDEAVGVALVERPGGLVDLDHVGLAVDDQGVGAAGRPSDAHRVDREALFAEQRQEQVAGAAAGRRQQLDLGAESCAHHRHVGRLAARRLEELVASTTPAAGPASRATRSIAGFVLTARDRGAGAAIRPGSPRSRRRAAPRPARPGRRCR